MSEDKKPVPGTVVRVKPMGLISRIAGEPYFEDNDQPAVVEVYGCAWRLGLEDIEVLGGPEMSITCQRCGASEESLLAFDFECHPGFDSIPGSVNDGPWHKDEGLSLLGELDRNVPFIRPSALDPDEAKCIGFVLCLRCGQMQGEWPLELSWAERGEEG